jgi:hypothetical protein
MPLHFSDEEMDLLRALAGTTPMIKASTSAPANEANRI